jgi:hypothetical protein
LSHHDLIAASVALPAPAVNPVETADRHRQCPAATLWQPHRRGPRPLAGETRGVARQPRPLSYDVASPQHFNRLLPLVVADLSGDVMPPQGSERIEHSRAPRPLDAPAPQRRREPRLVDAPQQDKTQQ